MKKGIIYLSLILFVFLILLLFFLNPLDSIKDIYTEPEIIIKNDDDIEIMHMINGKKTTPVNLKYISQKNIDILLFVEDRDFYRHSGFNILRIAKTIVSNLRNKKSAGASTITQQFIKNAYLNNRKTISRKIKEIYYAIKLEQAATKDEILASYLNCLYFGNNIYGLADAAKYYFNKDYSLLSVNEMTTLVAMINAPSYYSNNLSKLEIRKNKLLNTLYHNNIISTNEYLESNKKVLYNLNEYIYNSNLLYYTDELIKEYKALNINVKFNEKVTIYCKYNININKHTFVSEGDYSAMVVNKDGYIISMIGNKNYYASSFNIATKGVRDIGSTIKPLLYYEALKCGFDKNTMHYSAPYSITYKGTKITINNYASNYSYKNIDMKNALATSDNIYAIKTHQMLGFKTLVNHLKKYGIKSESLPSLALGSVGMSLYDLTRIYSQFFTEGKYLSFKYISKIYINDSIKYQGRTKFKTLGDDSLFKEIKHLMSSTFDPTIPHSTCGYLKNKLNSQCYGKSGLTDFDSYMIGFNEDILVSVWSGHLNNQELIDPKIKRLPKEIFVKLINSV